MEAVPEENQIISSLLMGDPNWICIFKPEASDNKVQRGNLRIKLSIDQITSISIDKSDIKRVNLFTQIQDE